MLRKVFADLGARRVRTQDGRLGQLIDIEFEDQSWQIRHLVVAVGFPKWSRAVLVSPRVFLGLPGFPHTIDLDLTNEQLRECPPLESDLPVSRQFKVGMGQVWQQTWGCLFFDPEFVGGVGSRGVFDAFPRPEDAYADLQKQRQGSTGDPHLRSCHDLRRASVRSKEGPVARLSEFIIDDESWELKFVVARTRQWGARGRVLLPVSTIRHINDSKKAITTKLTRRDFLSSLPFHESICDDPRQVVANFPAAAGQ